MKKLLCVAMALFIVLSLVACGKTEAPKTYEVAMITDVGTIDDKSFNQGTWEGVKKFAEENKLTYQYYQPAEATTEGYLASIDQAVKAGAKVIVTPGFLFEEPIFKAQDLYPEVNFILIDGYPHNADYSEYRTNDNAVGLCFAEEQVGYLAGYAAVKDGYTSLGFQGGMGVPAVKRYGYGFVQGAEAAAKELNVKVTLYYNYSGDFAATPENQARAASWYSNGVEIIFACGGSVGLSVMAAADAANKYVIGVDTDQSSLSATVVNSACKGLTQMTYDLLTQWKTGKFPGGQSLTGNAANNGVYMSMESNKFTNFSQADYDALFAKLASGEITLLKDDVELKDIPTTNVTVNFVD